MKTKIVATHDGVFHADDVLACAVLAMVGDFNGEKTSFIRTRDPHALIGADAVIDVGGVYDPAIDRFDHHQQGRAGTRENGIFYSSFGLVWLKYGIEVCLDYGATHGLSVARRVEELLVMPVDAVDNGQKLFQNGVQMFQGVEAMSLSAVLSSYNPSWHESDKDWDMAFANAVSTARDIITNTIRRAEGELRALKVVQDALDNTPRQAAILEIPVFVPWVEQVVGDFEHQALLYVIFKDETGKWMAQAIPPKLGSFEQRKPLPAAWAGLRDSQLQELTGVQDAIFCHPGRFICGAASREGARELARLAVKA